MTKNLFNVNKKSLFSLFLALAMVFSFIGISDTTLAGPDAVGVPTTSFDLIIGSDIITYTASNVEDDVELITTEYSILKRKAGATVEYYTGQGVDLKELIEANLPLGKTFDNVVSLNVTCNDSPVNLVQSFTASELFGDVYKYYPQNSTAGTAVPTTINFSSALTGTTLHGNDSIRLFVGQDGADDKNMPKCLKWVKSIEVVLN